MDVQWGWSFGVLHYPRCDMNENQTLSLRDDIDLGEDSACDRMLVSELSLHFLAMKLPSAVNVVTKRSGTQSDPILSMVLPSSS